MENLSTKSNAQTELSQQVCQHKYPGRIWTRIILVLALLLAGMPGTWFLGVRPYLHTQVLSQIHRAWNQAEAFQALSSVPPGPQTILLKERLLGQILTNDHADDRQIWQVTVTPASISLRMTICGSNCTVTALLAIDNKGQLQVIRVQMQGMLALILSDGELANDLNSNVQNFSASIRRYRVLKITLLEHAIDVQLY